MKIKSITISGMHNILGTSKTYTFKDINYIIGTNGAGKSTILQAIQLAILGYIPGTDKRVSEIFTHCPSRSMIVDLRLTDEDPVTESSKEAVRILRSWSLKGKSIKSDVTTVPEGFEISSLFSQIELPIFNFNEFLKLSRNQLKSWFLNFLPEPECKIDWKQEFEMALLSSGYVLADNSYIDEVIEECVAGDSGLSSVQGTNVGLKDFLSDKKLEVARLEGAVQALIFYDDIDSDDYEESKKEILDAISVIKKRRDDVFRIKHLWEVNSKLEDQITKLSESRVDATQLVQDKEFVANYDGQHVQEQFAEEEKALKEEIQGLTIKLASLQMDIISKQKILDGKGICPYSDTECRTISNLLETIESEVEELQNELTDVKNLESQKTEEIEEIRKKSFALAAKYGVAKQNIDYDTIAAQQIEDLKKQRVPLCEADLALLQTDTSELDDEEKQMQEKLTKLEANRSYEEKINEITSNKFKAENELEALKILIKRTDANNMQTEIAQLPFADFTAKMNTIIPDLFGNDTKFKINLEAKANSFSFGILKSATIGDVYIPYDLMSSGEKTLLAFAMMIYIVKQSSSDLKLVMVDDMLDHLDDANIELIFDKFSASDVQIINAGVKTIQNPKINIIQL